MTILNNTSLIQNLSSYQAYAKQLGLPELYIHYDPETHLQALIGIHSTKLGPALGGCRFAEYDSIERAIHDVARLATGMSYKAALANLPLGGGKAVIIKPKQILDREKFFAAFGGFVNTLNGRYITAVDAGTKAQDMDIIATQTSYVTCTSAAAQISDASYFTAIGVFRAIQAAVKFRFNTDNLTGLHVAVQGVGKVGMYLVKELAKHGVKLTIADTDAHKVEKCATDITAHVTSVDTIHTVDCDIFSPCALGAGLNNETIPAIKAAIIAGAANNQLKTPEDGMALLKRGILYAPDYVINSGGVIQAAAEYLKTSQEEASKQVNAIYDTSLMIFERSAKEQRDTSHIADDIAKERLQ